MPARAAPVLDRTGAPAVWSVAALVRAVGDAIEARFNPVAVRGELSGFSRASSGHCYFSLKDGDGQLRGAMFRRAAQLLDFAPRDGELVEVRGRLGVYGARGDLQLVAESMQRVGQGALFEEFVQRRARLEREGLFDASRKRAPVTAPRGIGLVTSLGAAALHDVATALARRAPHIPVWLVPAAVQGAGAPAELVAALSKLYLLSEAGRWLPADSTQKPVSVIDTILLVRGGGSIEDLWAFNDEALVRHIAASPVPVLVGVGHESDFTLADFVADVRAPTPTAAAELAAAPRDAALRHLDALEAALQGSVQATVDRAGQRTDAAAAQLLRPGQRIAQQQALLREHALALRSALRAPLATGLAQAARHAEQLRRAAAGAQGTAQRRLDRVAERLPVALRAQQSALAQRQQRAAMQLQLLDPQLVLERGYAWLHDTDGRTVRSPQQVQPGQAVAARVAEGRIALRVDGATP